MYCPQLTYPGTHIKDPDPAQASTKQIVLSALESSLVAAAVSLELFEASEVELQAHLLKRTESVKISAGLRKRPFLHAKSFVHSLYDVQKFIDVLGNLSGNSQEIDAASAELTSKLPDLKGVRDSEQHLEERLQGLTRGQKLPTSQLWIGNLMNKNYEMTTESGRIGRIEVSRETLDIAASCIQRTIDSLQWTGRRTVTNIH